jgi:hypothetical protein
VSGSSSWFCREHAGTDAVTPCENRICPAEGCGKFGHFQHASLPGKFCAKHSRCSDVLTVSGAQPTREQEIMEAGVKIEKGPEVKKASLAVSVLQRGQRGKENLEYKHICSKAEVVGESAQDDRESLMQASPEEENQDNKYSQAVNHIFSEPYEETYESISLGSGLLRAKTFSDLSGMTQRAIDETLEVSSVAPDVVEGDLSSGPRNSEVSFSAAELEWFECLKDD